MNRVIFVALLALAIPQITFAAWWNPLSWSVFNRGQNSSKVNMDELLEQYNSKEIETPQTTRFYIKYNDTRLRKCPSVNCDVKGYFSIGHYIDVTMPRAVTLNDLEEWSPVTEPDGSIGYLNKSVLSETPVSKSSSSELKNTPQSFPVGQAPWETGSSTSRNNNGVSSKDVIEYIDALISSQQSDLLYIGEHYSTHIDYYANWASEGKKLAAPSGNETDPYLKNNWKYIYDLFDSITKVSDKMKNGSEQVDSVQNILRFVDERRSYLRKLKNEVPKYYASEDIKTATLLKLIESDRSYKKSIIDGTYYGNNLYLEVVGIAMDKINETMEEIDAYLSRQKSNNSAIDRTIYRSITAPQIQMPKTTYCTMSGGLGGHYSIICN